MLKLTKLGDYAQEMRVTVTNMFFFSILSIYLYVNTLALAAWVAEVNQEFKKSSKTKSISS